MSDHMGEFAVEGEVAGGVELDGLEQDERGMTTAEYAVGTVAAVTLGGVLIKVVTDPSIFELILKIILWILKTITAVVL